MAFGKSSVRGIGEVPWFRGVAIAGDMNAVDIRMVARSVTGSLIKRWIFWIGDVDFIRAPEGWCWREQEIGRMGPADWFGAL